MIELEHVKKRRKKLAAAIIGLAGGSGVATLALVSFLGRHVGTFTVTLDTSDVQLALCQQYSFAEPSSYLRIENPYPYREYTYPWLPEASVLDNEESDYLLGSQTGGDGVTIEAMKFFKYTFYVKNVGRQTARYQMKLKIVEDVPSDDGRSLSDTLRVRLFANEGASSEHESTVYAKPSTRSTVLEDGTRTFNEPISAPYGTEEFVGWTEAFESSSVIKTFDVKRFDPENIQRYTLVSWIEGDDLDCDPTRGAPSGATIKLGVEINAYEN